MVPSPVSPELEASVSPAVTPVVHGANPQLALLAESSLVLGPSSSFPQPTAKTNTAHNLTHRIVR
jgi:hypothetical protein